MTSAATAERPKVGTQGPLAPGITDRMSGVGGSAPSAWNFPPIPEPDGLDNRDPGDRDTDDTEPAK